MSLRHWLMQVHSSDEDEQRRGKITIVLALLMSAMGLLSLPLVFLTTPQSAPALVVIALIGVVTYSTVIVLVRHGQVVVGSFSLVTVISFLILAATFVTANTNVTAYAAPFFLVLPLIIAGLVLPPPLIWALWLLNLVGMSVVWQSVGVPLWADHSGRLWQVAATFLQTGTAMFTFVSGWITNTALRESRQLREEAQQSATRLAQLNDQLELQVSQRTAALQTALHELEQRAAEQARLLAENEQQRQAIRELSVPVLPVRQTTLVMPLIGALDTARLLDMQQQALHQIERTGARELLIDVTGVPVIDTQVAQGLIQVVEAARLMGTQVTLVGIRPEVAQTLVTLGIDLQRIRTFSTLQAALTVVMAR